MALMSVVPDLGCPPMNTRGWDSLLYSYNSPVELYTAAVCPSFFRVTSVTQYDLMSRTRYTVNKDTTNFTHSSDNFWRLKLMLTVLIKRCNLLLRSMFAGGKNPTKMITIIQKHMYVTTV